MTTRICFHEALLNVPVAQSECLITREPDFAHYGSEHQITSGGGRGR